MKVLQQMHPSTNFMEISSAFNPVDITRNQTKGKARRKQSEA